MGTGLSRFDEPQTREGNGNPLQCSCLENPRDKGAWWAAVYGVAQSRTRLKRLSSSSSRQGRPLDFMLGLRLETPPVLISCVQSIGGSSGIYLLNISCTWSFLYCYCCSQSNLCKLSPQLPSNWLPGSVLALLPSIFHTGNRNIFLLQQVTPPHPA